MLGDSLAGFPSEGARTRDRGKRWLRPESGWKVAEAMPWRGRGVAAGRPRAGTLGVQPVDRYPPEMLRRRLRHRRTAWLLSVGHPRLTVSQSEGSRPASRRRELDLGVGSRHGGGVSRDPGFEYPRLRCK